MPVYVMNEGGFDIPAGWQDKTVTALVFPEYAASSDASLTVTRDPAAKQSPSLPAYVDKQLIDMARTCSQFDLIQREDVTLHGVQAQSIEYTWRRPDGKSVRQLQLVMLTSSRDALMFTGTALADDYPRYQDVLKRAILSFRFR